MASARTSTSSIASPALSESEPGLVHVLELLAKPGPVRDEAHRELV